MVYFNRGKAIGQLSKLDFILFNIYSAKKLQATDLYKQYVGPTHWQNWLLGSCNH